MSNKMCKAAVLAALNAEKHACSEHIPSLSQMHATLLRYLVKKTRNTIHSVPPASQLSNIFYWSVT